MRVLTFTIAIVAAYLILWTNMASAGNDTPGIDWREHNQKHRIYDGIQNGSLSFRETGQLLRGQVRVHRMERRAKRDGVVTRRERARIHHQQNRQSRRIHRKKHN